MDEINPSVKLEKEANSNSKEYILTQTRHFSLPGDYTEEFFDHLDALWTDRGVQDCFERSNEYQDCLYKIDCLKTIIYRISGNKIK